MDKSGKDLFQGLHPNLKAWIQQKDWPDFRPIQKESLLFLDMGFDLKDCIISAPTAGGKTEAAFLPLINRVRSDLDNADSKSSGVRLLCLCPTKSLINDQVKRLNSMCLSSRLTVQAWHSDVTKGKVGFWDNPKHVLVTTPESLEAMLMSKASQVTNALLPLTAIVIDEFHMFLGSPRGRQLLSLLARLEYRLQRPIPRIAVSATLGDPEAALEHLQDTTHYTDDHTGGKVITGEPGALLPKVQFRVIPYESDEKNLLPALVSNRIWEDVRNEKVLIFCRSRDSVDRLANAFRALGDTEGRAHHVHSHHAGVSAPAREALEIKLKNDPLPSLTLATSTMEVGVDIGDLDWVGQYEAPTSAASLKQRVGRSGRRNGQQQLLMIVPNKEQPQDPSLKKQKPQSPLINLSVMQSVAAVDLMFLGRFEKKEQQPADNSVLVQQVLSLLREEDSGLSVTSIYERLCLGGAFRHILAKKFRRVLNGLLEKKVIKEAKRQEQNIIVLGPVGEGLTEDREFYATFEAVEEFAVFHDGKKLGTAAISKVAPGSGLLLNGRFWTVVHSKGKCVFVQPPTAQIGDMAKMLSKGGSEVISPVLHEHIRLLYTSGKPPDFVSQEVAALIQKAHLRFGQLPWLDQGHLVCHSEKATLFWHWGGTILSETINLGLAGAGVKTVPVGRDAPYAAFDASAVPSLKDLCVAAKSYLSNIQDDPSHLAGSNLKKLTAAEKADLAQGFLLGKHDKWLSLDLLCETYAAEKLDIPRALVFFDDLLKLDLDEGH